MFVKISKIESLTSIASLKLKPTGGITTFKQDIHAAKHICLVSQSGRLEEQEQHGVFTVWLWMLQVVVTVVNSTVHCCTSCSFYGQCKTANKT